MFEGAIIEATMVWLILSCADHHCTKMVISREEWRCVEAARKFRRANHTDVRQLGEYPWSYCVPPKQ
jgi:hypothetical protein